MKGHKVLPGTKRHSTTTTSPFSPLSPPKLLTSARDRVVAVAALAEEGEVGLAGGGPEQPSLGWLREVQRAQLEPALPTTDGTGTGGHSSKLQSQQDRHRHRREQLKPAVPATDSTGSGGYSSNLHTGPVQSCAKDRA